MPIVLALSALTGLAAAFQSWRVHQRAMPQLAYLLLGISGAFLALTAGVVIGVALCFATASVVPALAGAFEQPEGRAARQFAVVLLLTSVPIALVSAGALVVAMIGKSRPHVKAALVPLALYAIASILVTTLEFSGGFYPA
jgi:hypothetical protein